MYTLIVIRERQMAYSLTPWRSHSLLSKLLSRHSKPRVTRSKSSPPIKGCSANHSSEWLFQKSKSISWRRRMYSPSVAKPTTTITVLPILNISFVKSKRYNDLLYYTSYGTPISRTSSSPGRLQIFKLCGELFYWALVVINLKPAFNDPAITKYQAYYQKKPDLRMIRLLPIFSVLLYVYRHAANAELNSQHDFWQLGLYVGHHRLGQALLELLC